MAASGRAATARRREINSRGLTRKQGGRRKEKFNSRKPKQRYYRRAFSDLSFGHGGTESLCGERLWIEQPGCSVRSGGIGHLEI